MTEYVFDTEAIIAYLYSEPGHETVAETLDTVFEDEIEGSLNEANASEVLCLVARFEGTGGDEPTKESLRDADCDLHALERRGLTIRAAPWRLTGEIKADGDISLADANAVALAADRHATLVVGPDDDFENPHIDFDPCQFRSDPV
jgi:predicted nucleic acid-binding protein